MAQQNPYNSPGQPPPAKKTSGCVIALIVIAVVAVPMLGIMASLGIYGVRRYLAAAKTSEAKNTIGAITRGAVGAYERETMVGGQVGHRLCGSAVAVPRAVPAAKRYIPSTAAGQDFSNGSPTAGWPCLRFAVTEGIYYQYHYQQGSGWVVPSIAPGPDGFEVAAHGDLDGNGTLSTFARVGKVGNGSLAVSTELYIENEFE